MRTIKWIYSWEGLEDQRDKIRNLAHDVVRTDSKVRRLFPSSIATGLICEAMNNPTATRSLEIADAARAQNELFSLHHTLVWDHKLDFVRLEWGPILDPSPEERERCERLARTNK